MIQLEPGTKTDLFDGVISIVVGTWGNDRIDLADLGNSAIVFGGPGHDKLRGSAYDDVLHGSWGRGLLTACGLPLNHSQPLSV